MKKTHRIFARVSEELHADAVKAAELSGEDISDIVRRAVARWAAGVIKAKGAK